MPSRKKTKLQLELITSPYFLTIHIGSRAFLSSYQVF